MRGFRDELVANNLDITYSYHNTQANMPTVLQIIRKTISESPDLVLAIATISIEATVQKIKLIPILFATITDPVNIELISSLEKSGHNIKDTTNITSSKAQINSIREIHPQAQKTGAIYSTSVANSIIQIKFLKTVPARHAIEVKQVDSQHRQNLSNYSEPDKQGRHNISAYRQYGHLQHGFHH